MFWFILKGSSDKWQDYRDRHVQLRTPHWSEPQVRDTITSELTAVALIFRAFSDAGFQDRLVVQEVIKVYHQLEGKEKILLN